MHFKWCPTAAPHFFVKLNTIIMVITNVRLVAYNACPTLNDGDLCLEIVGSIRKIRIIIVSIRLFQRGLIGCVPGNPVNTKHLCNIDKMLDKRRRRGADVV